MEYLLWLKTLPYRQKQQSQTHLCSISRLIPPYGRRQKPAFEISARIEATPPPPKKNSQWGTRSLGARNGVGSWRNGKNPTYR